MRHNIVMAEWEIEFTNEFEQWWNTLDETEQDAIAASVELVRTIGPSRPGPIPIR
jgi:hypothetical protein